MSLQSKVNKLTQSNEYYSKFKLKAEIEYDGLGEEEWSTTVVRAWKLIHWVCICVCMHVWVCVCGWVCGSVSVEHASIILAPLPLVFNIFGKNILILWAYNIFILFRYIFKLLRYNWRTWLVKWVFNIFILFRYSF